MIPEGTRWPYLFVLLFLVGCPCKLYFDIEYLFEVNQNSNGDQMIETLKDVRVGPLYLICILAYPCGDVSAGLPYQEHVYFCV